MSKQSSQNATDIWAALLAHRQQNQNLTAAELFSDSQRFAKFSLSSSELLVDFSKTQLTEQTIDLLLNLAEQSGVYTRRNMLFAGDVVNESENRAALHFALRANADDEIFQDNAQMLQQRKAMLDFADAVERGEITAADGKPFTDFLNIGIGGSELGPAMACAALHQCGHAGLRPHFISNMDGAHFADVVHDLSPQRTLVYISSKTLSTAETLANARMACAWLANGNAHSKGIGEENISAHLAVATASPDNLPSFINIPSSRIFSYPQTIGGRYSVWGSVGMPLAVAIGADKFNEFLRGGCDMDVHFRTAAPRHNIPLMLALINIWHRNICGYASRAVLPFDNRLRLFPAHIQQLEMESNGKSVQQNGKAINNNTVPIIWGSPANNAQHAYFQMLHQGSDIVPCDLLADGGNAPYATKDMPTDEYDERRQWLLSNCLAQSAALFFGKDCAENDLPPARHFGGGRPSVVILYKQLSPYVLGQLLAMYEHRVFVEGTIWNVNSFDQWGVELGKTLAKTIQQQMQSEQGGQDDSSTLGLIAHCNQWRKI